MVGTTDQRLQLAESDAMDVVTQGLEKLNRAQPATRLANGASNEEAAADGSIMREDTVQDEDKEKRIIHRGLETNVELIDVDPLSIDLPQAVVWLLETIRQMEATEGQENIGVGATAGAILEYLEKWASAPERATVGGVLDRLSALLLLAATDDLGEWSSRALGIASTGDAPVSSRWTDGRLALAVSTVFRTILVDLVARWTLPEAPVAVFRHAIPAAHTGDLHAEADLRVAYAAGILLGTAPQIRSLVTDYFEHRSGSSIAQHAVAAANSPRRQEAILVVAYRLLRKLPEIIDGIETWDWMAPLVTLMGTASTPLARLLACECACVVKALSDSGRATLLRSLGINDTLLVAHTQAWLGSGERSFDEAASSMMARANQQGYRRGLWLPQPAEDAAAATTTSTRYPWIKESDLARCVASVGGVLLHAHHAPASGTTALADTNGSGSLVLTPTVVRNIREMALATSRSEPVLLQGPSGSGKTSLVEWVARRTGNELVTIHLSSSMDAKVLLGNYVTTQRAGDFEWRAGLLTTAVAQGQWVLIENIDLAPADVIQTLVPLLESHTLFLATRGEAVRAHIRFRLFATLSAGASASASAGRMGGDGLLGSSMWTRLAIESLESEVPLIIGGAFPRLAPQAPAIAASFAAAAAIVSANSSPAPGGGAGRSAASPFLSTGDLVKWCARLSQRSEPDDAFAMFQEAVDVFTMREPDYDKWRRLVQRVGAAAFGIAAHRTDQFIAQHSPGVAATGMALAVGRALLPIADAPAPAARMPFATTRHASCLLERIAMCVQLAEPALLLGETGTGKTTVVQHLAALARRPLSVFNLSQQSDSSDLLGGFRPVDISVFALRLRESFGALFGRTVSVRKNAAFLDSVRTAFGKRDWRRLAGLFRASVARAEQAIAKARAAASAEASQQNGQQQRKKQRLTRESADELEAEWREFSARVEEFEALKGVRMVFSFVEGALVKAARSGGWILLDEINLATAETLACLGGLLQKREARSLLLAETGVRIKCHPEFRLFACMNPANDVGKRDLPPGLRSSFTEFFVHPPDSHADDLLAIVRSHLPPTTPPAVAHRVIGFYGAGKRLASDHRLVDGAGQKPHYSLRTLARALTYARDHAPAYSLKRALHDGLCMTFITQLDGATQPLLAAELRAVFEGDDLRQLLSRVPPSRAGPGAAVLVQGFWLPVSAELGAEEDAASGGAYVMTPSVETKLRSLARAVMCARYPVLIQGPTSAGKTSMVQHLARATGHRFVRINNHEHTDLQEYLGAYASAADGRLVFEEGLLVKALRHGHWLVLDELNLAPSDVLEALNRLLDDNRELVVPETQETVRPHPHFMLFATQNPAGLYGGRKALSRAFRNRFVELHFDDIPEAELQQIITDSCRVPPTHASLLVSAYRSLTQARAQSRIFEASHGFVTLRDLFRWANRHAATRDELAAHGFMLLAERVRSADDRQVVRRAIERAFYSKGPGARRTIDVDALYSEASLRAMPEFQAFEAQAATAAPSVAWTSAMRRLFILTALCLRFHEPVLLVGETGCGKTTVCQMLAAARAQRLHIVNCHQNTESSDVLGGQRPVRNRAALVEAANAILQASSAAGLLSAHGSVDSVGALEELVSRWRGSDDPGTRALADANAQQLQRAHELLARAQALFAWHDGPLVQAMKQGDMFLMDELNLADDSVLERLNSVLEPSRTLVLAENVSAADAPSSSVATAAADGFEFVATMNPGGDYGKRELSPALRNRFTELWAPTTQDTGDLRMILLKRLGSSSSGGGGGVPPHEAAACADAILAYVACLQTELGVLQHPLSLRDYLFWADFVAKTHALLGARAGVVHGACLVLLDAVGAQGSAVYGGASAARLPARVKAECVARLCGIVGIAQAEAALMVGVAPSRDLATAAEPLASRIRRKHEESDGAAMVGVAPFFVECGGARAPAPDGSAFALDAPTTFDNLLKMLRAMQVGKPLLLEGSPGVGKTTLVSTLARLAGHRLVRINLSDQTDLMDLFGTDLPVDGGFAWCDAPFLRALKRGDWVLLDEINLASQSVLEGLNSCLDHRGAVYIAELDREFALAPGFRVFAAQNPLGQGGGRKGLPRSFVNRFTQVYMDELTRDDLLAICSAVYGTGSEPVGSATQRILDFNGRMHDATMARREFGAAGAPWEFNLRDVGRFMELAQQPSRLEAGPKPVDEFVAMLYIQRMRTHADRLHVAALFRTVFGRNVDIRAPVVHITDELVQVGNAVLPRRTSSGNSGGAVLEHTARLACLHGQLGCLESLAKCVEMRWLAILVGPAGCGKTSMVRWLASATGNRLVEFSMNSGVDTSEIIGGFEQVDIQRHRTALLARVEALLGRALLAAPDPGSESGAALARAFSQFHRVKSCASTGGLCAAVAQIVDTVDWIAAEQTESVRQAMRDLAALEAAGRFEWVDGVLVDALLNGHWLLVDRANLCSASVLDRLNGLLEPGGVLHVTEDPKRTGPVIPHPNFRIVMAVDPMHGELSRAMRNRGIEICVLPLAATGCSSADRAVVARSVGLSSSLVPSDMPPHSTLTSVAHQAVRVAERTQRGYAARLVGDGCAADLLASYYAPSARGSSVSVARWQAHLARRALASGTARERQALLAATIGTLPPDADSLGAALFSAILASDSNREESALVAALLAAPLAGAVRRARAQVAAECQLDSEILRSAPSLVPLNAALHRALQRNITGDSRAVRWHQVLCAALVFQRERIASMSGAADAGNDAMSPTTSASARRAALLRQPDADVAHLQRVLDVADGCDLLIGEWEASVVANPGATTAVGDCSADSDLASCVPVLRSLYRLAIRIRHLVAGENGNGGSVGDNSSALAVAFEETQAALHRMIALTNSRPNSVGAQIQLTLARVRPLVLDAAHSARLWLLVHPVTLCDANERQIEARLLAAHKHITLTMEAAVDETHTSGQPAVFSDEMREAVVEAIAMLYATASTRGSSKSRHLVVGAIARFADSLPALDPSGTQGEGENGDANGIGMSLAAVLGDIRSLADWQQVAQLAVLASGSSSHTAGQNGSSLQGLSVARLRATVVASMSVGSESPWAPVFARLSWALNEHGRAAKTKRGEGMLANALPLAIDIIDQWHDQLHSKTVAEALPDSSAALLRLARPVATELAWRHSAGLLDCALEDHGSARDDVVGMLRALTTYTPPNPAPSRDLAALVWLLAVAAVTVCDTAEEEPCAELQRLSSALASALLRTSERCSLNIEAAAGRWRVALDRVIATDDRLPLCIAPAADAVCAAAAQNSTAARRGVLAATIAVHSGMLALSVPHRAVDPAARAHTRWEWLGDDIDTARAQLAAIRDVQRAMTGDTDTAATRPLAADVAALEARQAGIDRVFRPSPSDRDAAAPFAELWHEARTLCAGVLGRVRDVCAQLLQGAELPLAAADALVATLAQFQARVRARYYAAFRDVAQIWCVHVRTIAYALAQLADECRRTDPRTAVHRENARLVAQIYAMPAAAGSGVPATEASNAEMQRALARLKAVAFFAPKQEGEDGAGSEDANAAGGGKGRALRTYGELVRALLLRTALGVQARGRLAAPDVAALDAVFRDAHDIHHRAVEAKRKRDAEAASLFKMRARPDPTDDDLVRELFPGYEDLFADEENEESGGVSIGDSDAASGSSPAADDDLDGDTVAAIAACHQYAMLQFGTAGCAPDLRPSLVREARRAALHLAASVHTVRRDTASMLPDGADAMLRAANMAALADAASATDSANGSSSQQPHGESGTRTTRVRDFYRDPWPSESVRARPVAQAIRARATALLQEWPDHAGLQLIRDAATRVLAQPATAPVAQVLAGVEQLYTRAQESWETHAARETSMGAELEEAARLVVRWRQLELNAWPHVLRAQELACARRVASEWWFSLYAVLVASGEASPTGAELAAALDRFAHGCPAGEFRARLNLLLAFAAHRAAIVAARTLASSDSEGSVADALRADPVYGPLSNAVAYYLQFAPVVADHLARGKQPVARDLAQYVKISAWKDANPAALRASAQRTHRHLAKCVRRLRDTLEQPVFQIIQAHQAASVSTARVPSVVLVSAPLADAGIEAAPAVPSLETATRAGAAAAWMPGQREPDAEDAMRVAVLARLADPAVAEVVGASAGALIRLRRMLEASRVVGRKPSVGTEAAAAEATDVFGGFARRAAADIHYFQSMETPPRLLARKTSGDGSAGRSSKKKQQPPKTRGKHVIGGSSSTAADAAAAEDGAEIDEEERQRLVRRFWGEQRNLRRTRLKEILRGMQDLGLKRHFRAPTEASAPTGENGGAEGTTSDTSAAAPGLGALLLQLRPLDIASWQSAVSQASAADSQLVLSTSETTLRSLRMADAAFFQLAAQMSQLRAAAFDDARSPEVPGAQVRAITGLVECLHSLAVSDRQCAADLVADAATLMSAASAWGESSASAVPASDVSGSFVVEELKLAADSAMAQLTQLLADVDAVSGAGGWDSAHPGAVECAVSRIRAASDQFAAAHALLGSASAMAIALASAGVDALTANICTRSSPPVGAAREALARAAHAVAEALQLARTDLDPRVLDPWVQPALVSVSRVAELCADCVDASDAEPSSDDATWASAVAATAGRWITGVMGVWQAIRAAEATSALSSADEKRNIWGLAPKELVRRLGTHQALAQSLQLRTMVPVLRGLTREYYRSCQHSASNSGGSAAMLETRGAVFRCVQPWVRQYLLLVQAVVAEHAELHRSVVHFALGMAASLTSAMVHGMGPQDEPLEPEDAGDTSAQTTGTGMGEGSTAGAKNVSDEIEGEDQIEGLRDQNDKENQEDEDEEEPATNEDAVEMSGDFNGTLGDADLESDDSDGSDSSSDDDDSDREMDEQIGDVDPTDPTALDEKLWDDKDENDENDKDGDSKDTDQTVESSAKQAKSETDIVAGQEGDDEGDPQKQQQKDEEEEEAAAAGQPEHDDGGDEDDEMRSDGESGDNDSDGEELDPRTNKDTLDRMADADDLGDQLEMPEGLDIDGDADQSENEDDDDGIEADDDLAAEEDAIDQKPSAATAEEEEEENDDEGPRTDGADEAMDGGEETAERDGDGDGDDGSAMDEDAAEEDDDGDGAGQPEEAGSTGDPDEEDEGRDNTLLDDESRLSNNNEDESSGANRPTGGLDAAVNLDGNDQPNTAAEAQDSQPQPADDDSSSQQQQQQRMTRPDASGTTQPQPQDQIQSQNQTQAQIQSEDRKRPQMDSERTLADVIEKWERRLDLVMRDEAEEEEAEAEDAPADSNGNGDGEQSLAPEASEFEHIKGEDDAYDKVALADANDEELEKQQHQPMDIDEEEEEEEDNANGQQNQQQQGQQDQEQEQQAGSDSAHQRQQQHQPEEEEKEDAGRTQAPENPQSRVEPRPNRQPPPESGERSNMADAAQLQQSVAAVEPDGDGDERMSEDEDDGEIANDGIDIDQLRSDLETATSEWRAQTTQDAERAAQLWQAYSRLTHDLALSLTEQLRLILTPTQATQLRGDYRTGKRLNMKRIIPYIASDFRKDKIWLRRTKPARREYQVMVSLDNSKSMAQTAHAVELAYETLALITTALTQLEVGQLSVVSFGEQVSLLHPFDATFDADAGARVLSRFTFDDDKTNVVQLMDASLQLFEAAEATSSASADELWRLQLVVSDGVCQDHARLLQQVRAASERRVMVVFIVLDRAAGSAGPAGPAGPDSEAADADKNSIMNTQHVSFVKGVNGRMEMRVERYLDTFPFNYYVVLRDIAGLPAVLAEALRQYFSLVGNT
ncbi:AAA ATPase midasin [Coemansia sp. RSA 1200]|nr:AAA ATPase midasin [Coemansia sp. RSA 1200]